jgi:predicted nucleic acid-binding protein
VPEELPRLASDPADDHVAATAIYGRAETLVTSERRLLEDGTYELEGQTVEVISFEEFSSRIETSSFSLTQVPELLAVPAKPGLPELDLDL